MVNSKTNVSLSLINHEEGKTMKNKKKKGFTLIELIAVIAILGILAAILVPNIVGYTNKAKKGKITADAKIVLNAIKTYNSDATTPISNFNQISDKNNYLDNPSKLDGDLLTADTTKLQSLADGTVTDSDLTTYYTK